uniref:CCHC-type domain-containing protein n=1 Tax=Caenorhabditis japonica TaxID=281687 RepID=A0A8R1DV45_CAEJA
MLVICNVANRGGIDFAEMSSPDQELVRMLVEAIKPELKSIAKQEERAPVVSSKGIQVQLNLNIKVLNKLAEIPEATTPVEVKEATEWLRRRNADLVLLDTDPEALKMIEKVSTLTAATGAGAGGSSEAMQMMIMSRLLSDNARKRKASPPQRPTNWFRGESSERRQFGARGFAQARTTGGTFKSYVNSTPKNPRCFQCHQVGHFAANCHARRYDFSRKAHPLRGVLGSVALPFGLSTAPWLFTKLFRPLVTKWRAEGIWVWLYLDDGLVLAKSWEESQRAKQIVKGDLERAGVCLAEEKCNWVPQSSFCWLGLQGDLVAGTVKLTAKRRKKVEEAIECLYRSQAPTVLDRMKLLGQLSAMTVIAGPTGVARARRMMEVVAEAQSSETGQKVRITKTPGEVKELLYWRDRIREDPVNTFEESFNPVWELYTDASAIGMGAVLKDKKGRQKWRISKRGNEEFQKESSAMRELKAVEMAAKGMAGWLKGDTKIFVDSQAAVAILNKGSMKPDLQTVAENIWQNFEKIGNTKFLWIPRKENEDADLASRTFDFDDWGLGEEVFNWAQKRWGTIGVDWFADSDNTKTEVFYSRFPTRGSSGANVFDYIDVLSQRRDLHWWVPPPNLVPRLVHEAKKWKLKGILGVPIWRGHVSYQAITNEKGEFKNEIRERRIYPVNSRIIIPGEGSKFCEAMASNFTRSPFLVGLLDFSQ